MNDIKFKPIAIKYGTYVHNNEHKLDLYKHLINQTTKDSDGGYVYVQSTDRTIKGMYRVTKTVVSKIVYQPVCELKVVE